MSSVVTEVDAPAFPPRYDPSQWLGENLVKALTNYAGTQFSLEFLREKIVGMSDFPYAFILDVGIKVANAQFSVAKNDENYPIYFEVSGHTYQYVISAWADRVEIKVCDSGYKPLSYMFPVTEDELVQALDTVIYDYLVGIR